METLFTTNPNSLKLHTWLTQVWTIQTLPTWPMSWSGVEPRPSDIQMKQATGTCYPSDLGYLLKGHQSLKS